MNKPARKPDWRISTPSQIDPERWVVIGAAWNSRTNDGVRYINVQLDAMPTTGRLSLFPYGRSRKEASEESAE